MRFLDHSNPAVWIPEGKPAIINRVFHHGGKKVEASITFKVDSDLLKQPNGIVKRFFGKVQRVIEEDVIAKFGGKNEACNVEKSLI